MGQGQSATVAPAPVPSAPPANANSTNANAKNKNTAPTNTGFYQGGRRKSRHARKHHKKTKRRL